MLVHDINPSISTQSFVHIFIHKMLNHLLMSTLDSRRSQQASGLHPVYTGRRVVNDSPPDLSVKPYNEL